MNSYAECLNHVNCAGHLWILLDFSEDLEMTLSELIASLYHHGQSWETSSSDMIAGEVEAVRVENRICLVPEVDGLLCQLPKGLITGPSWGMS